MSIFLFGEEKNINQKTKPNLIYFYVFWVLFFWDIKYISVKVVKHPQSLSIISGNILFESFFVNICAIAYIGYIP